MGIISLIFFALKDPSLAWVFVAYAFGGIGIGISLLFILVK